LCPAMPMIAMFTGAPAGCASHASSPPPDCGHASYTPTSIATDDGPTSTTHVPSHGITNSNHTSLSSMPVKPHGRAGPSVVAPQLSHTKLPVTSCAFGQSSFDGPGASNAPTSH